MSSEDLGWDYRVGRLKEGLGREATGLVGEIMGMRVGFGWQDLGIGIKMQETLVKAVGEIVRIGEEVRSRDDIGRY